MTERFYMSVQEFERSKPRSVWMSEYWRAWREAKKKGLNNTEAKREAKFITSMWYHRMKNFAAKMAKETVTGGRK